MKKFYFLATLCAIASISFAQQTNPKDTMATKNNNDTIRIGNILIIKRHSKISKGDSTNVIADIELKKKKRHKSINYFVFDLGFANWDDKTNYSTAGNFVINKPGGTAFSASDLKPRSGKSINLNIWIFMQKYSLVKNNVNIKYGLGLELNNYHFRSPVSFKEGGPQPYSVGGIIANAPFVYRDTISFSKNKLAADYLTVPLMLNFATNRTPGKPTLSASFGVSAGYLYSQRNKQRSTERGKQKNKGDYDMERFKLSYIGEIGLGSIRLYGSYSPKSIFERDLDIRPFNIGFRFSNW